MSFNVARKLIASHLVVGQMVPGTEIGLRIDQTLTNMRSAYTGDV